MNYKKWSLSILISLCLLMTGIMGINYVVDPFGYFVFQSGDVQKADFTVDTTYALRELKAQNIIHQGEQYDAYIIGGSKAGTYSSEILSKIDGYRYYNLFEIAGNFYEYELMTDFLFRYSNPKKMILHLSGSEVKAYERSQMEVNKRIPAVEKGSSKLIEYMDFLTMDIQNSFQRLKERRNETMQVGILPDGSKDLENLYLMMRKDPDEYVKAQVNKRFTKQMKTLFTTNVKRKYYDDNLASLKRIKRKCEENGTELMVLVAPSYIGEMSEHDTTYYWEYLKQIAAITDYWDFSGYNDINLNPYNYYNAGHYFYEVAELMMDTINGTENYPGFGEYVTLENVSSHIAKRKADYERLRQEYKQTGTIQLQRWEDTSCLVNKERVRE